MISSLEKEGHDYTGAGSIALPDRPAPRPLTVSEIKHYVEIYGKAADNAIKAGFDGVELHMANSYLPDQFFQDVSNNRVDEYGGSIENRVRFSLEVIESVVKTIGQEKTAIRISPWNPFNGVFATRSKRFLLLTNGHNQGCE